MKLYDELAEWWPLFSEPQHYRDEAEFFRELIEHESAGMARTMLELGAGGGNNASHLKHRFAMTLVDLSPEMTALSRALNPECEHVQADMRTVRLDRHFDAVFVHDAIMYMMNADDLSQVIATTYSHCRAGGVVLFVPDYTRETFIERTDHGGRNLGRRGLRYLEWTFDPDPADSTYVTEFAILTREEDGETRVVHDRHVEGLFARSQWLTLLRGAGFDARVIRDKWERDVFLARRQMTEKEVQ
jgi:SAM-dependent methyltransferase